jgi:uncharacterized protein
MNTKNAFKQILLALVLLVSQIATAHAAPANADAVDPKKSAVIRELLQVTGTMDLIKQMMGQLAVSMKNGRTEAEQKMIDRLIAKMDPNELSNEMIAIYDRNLSLEDLEAVVAFYKTPAGKNLIQKIPLITSESMQLGQAWGQRKGEELIKELEAEKKAN